MAVKCVDPCHFFWVVMHPPLHRAVLRSGWRRGLALAMQQCWGRGVGGHDSSFLTVYFCHVFSPLKAFTVLYLERERSAHVCLLVTAPSVCLSGDWSGLGTLNVGSPEKHTFPPKSVQMM